MKPLLRIHLMKTNPSALSSSQSLGRHLWWVLVAVCLMAQAVGLSAQEIPKIRIGIEFNSPPLSYVEADGTPQGFTPELLRAMQATGRVEFEIVPQYWSNILAKFKTGQLDALANVQLLAERRETMEFSIPHAALHGVAYTQPGVEPVTATAQFAGKKMAMLSGTTSQRNAVERHGWGAQIVIFKSWQTMLQSVQDGECDFALVLRSLRFEQPDELGLHRAFVDDIVHEFRIAVHRDDHVTLERINDALAEVREGGIFRELNAKWIGPIEPQPIKLVDLQPYYFPVIAVFIAVGLLLFWQRHQNQRLLAKARELQVTQDMLNSTGQIAQVGGWELDLKTQRVFWSDETCRLHGVEPGTEIALEEAINFYAPESRPIIQAALQKCIEQGTPWDLELELIGVHGRHFWARAQGAPVLEDGKVVRLCGAFQDITTHKQALALLQESENRWRFAIEGSGDGLWDWNVPAGTVFFSPRWKEMLGFNDAEIGASLKEWSNRVHPEDLPGVMTVLQTHLSGNTPLYVSEHRVSCKDGSWKWVLDRGLVVERDPAGQPLRVIGTHKDVTAQKQGEMELTQSLHEKEALLKEVHHRVKNNMQVISSLLRLEAAKHTAPETKDALRDMQGRIRSMALLHETLYRSGDFARVNLDNYLRDLSTQFFRAQNVAPQLVALGFELSAVKVEIDQAIPCGLIVNELLTNALKYGFPQGRSGMVRVGLNLNADGEVQLQVSDDGVGLPPDLDIMQSNSLGLRLVSDLTRQLQGNLVIEAPAQFTIRFKPKVPHHSKPPF